MIKDLANTLDFLGVKKGDAVFVHSDLSNFKFINSDFWTLSDDIFHIIFSMHFVMDFFLEVNLI